MKTKEIILSIFLFIIVISGILLRPQDVNAEETEGNYAYEVENGYAYIVEYLGKEEKVVVPAKLGGYQVQGVRYGTFSYNDYVKTITFSEGIEWLGSGSIYQCNKLTTVSLPSTLNEWGINDAINECSSISEIKIADGNQYFKVYEGAVYTSDMKKLCYYPQGNTQNTLVIPDGVEQIGSGACRDNEYVKKIIMPDTVKYIGSLAFFNNS